MAITGERFVEALRELEEGGEPDEIVKLFARDAVCGNAAGSGTDARGHDQIREFWAQDAKHFSGMRSDFQSVIEADGAIALVWTRKGDGAEVPGVSVLEHADGEIWSFRAYFDSDKSPAANS